MWRFPLNFQHCDELLVNSNLSNPRAGGRLVEQMWLSYFWLLQRGSQEGGDVSRHLCLPGLPAGRRAEAAPRRQVLIQHSPSSTCLLGDKIIIGPILNGRGIFFCKVSCDIILTARCPSLQSFHCSQVSMSLDLFIQGASAKTYLKMLVEQSQNLESGHLYSYFCYTCHLTKPKLKIETF